MFLKLEYQKVFFKMANSIIIIKNIYFIIFSKSLMSNCFAQKNDQILLEINSIENYTRILKLNISKFYFLLC